MIFENALEHANKILDIIRPTCERVELVGSLKRADKHEVGDIEFLLIPKDQRPVATFGRPKEVFGSIFEKALYDMEGEGMLKQSAVKKCDGPKQKRRAIVGVGGINEFCVEFFIVNPKTWGVLNVIRTGPALFSHRYVTNKRTALIVKEMNGEEFRGLLPNHLEWVRGEASIKHNGRILDLPEETDAIDILGLGWIAPADRGRVALRK